MSKYTTLLRWIVEQEQGKVPFNEEIRYNNDTYTKIGLDSYPIFNENYRSYLNDKIIDHFYFREIGFETVALFAWYMRRTMNEIMPYFNEMYLAQAKIDDPLNNLSKNWKETWDSNIEDTGTIQNENASTTEVDSSGTTNNTSIYSDTPMSLLSNEGSPSVANLDYATNVTYDNGGSTDESTTEVSGNITQTLDTDRHDHGFRSHEEVGRNKSQAELMKEYLDMFVNIDMKVIEKLEDLFLGLW